MAKKKSSRERQSTNVGPELDALPKMPFDRRSMEEMMRQLAPGRSREQTSVDAAQSIIYQAFEAATPKRRIALALKALEKSKDCADAYVLLAEHAESLPEAMEFYEQGVAAGERALGRKAFQELDGHFWGFLETRPYMRARQGLADCLSAAGKRAEAADHFREMLRLNPNDNQGIRYRLASILLDLEQHDELQKLLDQYEEDSSADWTFTRALLAFRQEGDSPRARQFLREAAADNRYVPEYLVGTRHLPAEMPEYITWGGEDEAVGYAAEYLPAWKNTPGAITWLRKTLKVALPKSPRSRTIPWSKQQASLAQLPQAANEVWEIDIRATDGFIPGVEGPDAPWMIVVWNATQQGLVMFHPLDSRPKDAEVWKRLLDCFRDPEFGEPHRPHTIRVARKTWHRAWAAKLLDIGIDCQWYEQLAELERWFEHADSALAKLASIPDHDSAAELDWSQIVSLPQIAEATWQADVRQMPAWVQIADEPSRPWICLVADAESNAILTTDIASQNPHEDWLQRGVWQALNAPAAGEPHRPGRIEVASETSRALLAPVLEPVGIECVVKSDLDFLQFLVGELAETLGGQQRIPALIDSPGVTPDQLKSLFTAAADFYRSQPWRRVPGDTVIRVECDRYQSGPWYAVVMGQSGMELGIALYEDLKVLETILQGEMTDRESARRTSAISVTYGEPFDIAPQDLELAEKHGWPIAGPEAFPCVMRVKPGLAMRGPLQWELELLEGCLRAIPEFIASGGDQRQVCVALSVGTAALQLSLIDNLGGRKVR